MAALEADSHKPMQMFGAANSPVKRQTMNLQWLQAKELGNPIYIMHKGVVKCAVEAEDRLPVSSTVLQWEQATSL